MSTIANLSQIRPTYTGYHQRKRSSIRPCQHSHQESDDVARPNTTALGRTLGQLAYKTVDFAQEDMRNTFRKDMNHFIDNKIKLFTHKRQLQFIPQDNFLAYTMRSTINPQSPQNSKQFRNSPRNIKQMKLSNFLLKHSPHKQRIIAEPYLKNDKQKIARIISKRHEQQQEYQSLKIILKTRCSSQPNKRRTLVRQQQIKKSVNKQPWMVGWIQQKKLEQNRYRKRLIVRHQMRNLTIDI